MFYDRKSHCFFSRQLLPVTKQSRIPVPLGSRNDPWKDWEEDFRALCNTESTVTSQLRANAGIASWECDFDEVCSQDHDFKDVDFQPKAVDRDQSDNPASLSISIDDSFSVNAGGSYNTNPGFNDSTSSMVTIIPVTHASNNERQAQQTTESFSSPAVNLERVSSIFEGQRKSEYAPQHYFDAALESDGLPKLAEDALGLNDVTLQMEPSVLLFDMKSLQDSDDSESTRVYSSLTASFPTNGLQLTNTLSKHDVHSDISSVGQTNQEPTAEDSEASKIHPAKHNRASALSPIFCAICQWEHSNERVSTLMGLEIWRNCWWKPP